MALTRWALRCYGALLVLGITWPFLLPGEAFALRDMMVFADMALTRASLGFGDLAARNVPQDALLGLFPWPVMLLRVLVVGSAAWAAVVACRLGRTPFASAAAMTVAVWNPFVVERLLQGQWSLAVAAWLLPAVALGAPGAIAAQWVASLTPTGAIAAGLHSRRVLLSVVLCAPWAVAGLVAGGAGTSSPASVAAFAPRAEGYVGTLGALLGLGGIWNGAAVPASREAGFALFGVALFVVLASGWRAVPRRLLWLAVLGFGVGFAAWAGWTAPVVEHMPGGGLLRDGQKWLILAIPAYVTAAANLPGVRAPLAVGFALAQLIDAPLALAPLRPTTIAVPEVDHQGRDVLFLSRPALDKRADGAVIVDPAPKAMNVVESGALVVDGVVVDAPAPRWVAAHAPDADYAALGIGVVVYPDGRQVNTGAPAHGLPPLGILLFMIWCAAPLVTCANLVGKRQ